MPHDTTLFKLMNKHESSRKDPRENFPPAFEPTNLWSYRNLRRRVAAESLSEAQDAAEFGRHHWSRQGAMVALTALPTPSRGCQLRSLTR